MLLWLTEDQINVYLSSIDPAGESVLIKCLEEIKVEPIIVAFSKPPVPVDKSSKHIEVTTENTKLQLKVLV